uniref:SAM-dependent methyltransferase n=1 Tax=Nonomuraea lactucae TaxID=2249762 RepID=UPI000DE30996
RARFGRTVVQAAGTATCSAGDSPHLQVVADLAAALDAGQLAAKLGFARRHAGSLLASRVPDRLITTERVPAVERFFRLPEEGADRLYALTSSLNDDAALVDDPWEFEASVYEASRLDATAAWVARSCAPDDGPIVEVGACQGALTARLAAKGYTVLAAEPNPAFRARLEAGPQVRVLRDSLEDLAARRGHPARAYLLSEMLYYGQDLDLLHELPTDLLMISLAGEWLNETIWPWVREQSTWRVAEWCELAAPALEFVCDGRAYLRKRGSRGLTLTRAGGAA